MQQKTKQFLAGIFLVLVTIACVLWVGYHMIVRPILTAYDKYGWLGAIIASFALTVFYLLAYAIIKLVLWAIDTIDL